ncbi:MAG: DMT family transporter [Myxococcota bacterium]
MTLPWGELCAVLAAATWSFSVILFKRSEDVGAQGMNLFKNVLAAVLLLVTVPVLGVELLPARSPTDWIRIAISGVLGIALADSLIFAALRRLGAARLAVVDTAYAPVMVVLSVVVLDERMTPAFLVGATLVVGGLLATQVERPRSVGPPASSMVGVAFGLIGIVTMGVGVIVVKPVLEKAELVEVTLMRLLAGVFGQLVWVAFRPQARKALAVFRPQPAHRTLVPAAVLGSYIAMLLWLAGFKYTHASVASVLNQLSAVFTIVFARLFLGERLSPRRMMGAALATAGAVLCVV